MQLRRLTVGALDEVGQRGAILRWQVRPTALQDLLQQDARLDREAVMLVFIDAGDEHLGAGERVAHLVREAAGHLLLGHLFLQPEEAGVRAGQLRRLLSHLPSEVCVAPPQGALAEPDGEGEQDRGGGDSDGAEPPRLPPGAPHGEGELGHGSERADATARARFEDVAPRGEACVRHRGAALGPPGGDRARGGAPRAPAPHGRRTSAKRARRRRCSPRRAGRRRARRGPAPGRPCAGRPRGPKAAAARARQRARRGTGRGRPACQSTRRRRRRPRTRRCCSRWRRAPPGRWNR